MAIQKDYTNKLCAKVDDNLTSKPLSSVKTTTFTELFEEVIRMIGSNQNITLTLNDFHKCLKRAYDRGYTNAYDLYNTPTSTPQTPQTPATNQPVAPAPEPNKPKTPDTTSPWITWPWGPYTPPTTPIPTTNPVPWIPNIVYCDPNAKLTTTYTTAYSF